MPSSFWKADEPGVLDAVALRRRGREDDALGQLLFGLELDLVVGPGQHPDPLRGVLIFLRHSIRHAGTVRPAGRREVFQRERLAESVHDPAVNSPRQSQFSEFPLEQRLLVEGVRNLARLGEEARGRCTPRSADRHG